MTTHPARWLGGLMLLVAVALLFWLLVGVGAPRWLAVVVGILAAVSLEPTSYARRTLRRLDR